MSGLGQSVYEASLKDRDTENRKLPIRGVVARALPSYDAVDVDMALEAGTTRMQVCHPYFGVNSWIRVMPDAGTNVLTQTRGDLQNEEVTGYLASNSPKRIKRFKEGNGLFRPMDEGEIDMMSSGRAYIHLGSGGDVEMRGGVIRQELSQSRLELRACSPLYIRALHRGDPSKLQYQERFGIVKRADTKYPNAMQRFIKDQNDEFQYEYSRWLYDKDAKPFVTLQEGVVVDDAGQEVKQASTNKTLRYRKQFMQVKTDEFLFIEVDDELNTLISCNADSSKETKIDLGKENVLKLSCRDSKLDIIKTGTEQYGTSLTVTSPTISYDASTSYTVKTAKVHLNSSMVHFGSNPVMPVALAGPLVTALTTMLGVAQGAMQAIGADPATIAASPAMAAASAAAAVAIGATMPSLQNIPSTQVLASG